MRGLLFVPAFATTFGTIVLAQSSITPTKPLTAPGMNLLPALPPATALKNSPGSGGSGLGLGAQSVPGISSVTNPQASKGGSDAEKIDNSVGQRRWLPQNFRLNVEGFEKSTKKVEKVDGLATKQSTNPDGIGAARDYAKPPGETKKGESAPAKFKSAKPKTMEFELLLDGWETSKSGPAPKVAPLGSGPQVPPGLPPSATLPATRKTAPGIPAVNTKGSWGDWYIDSVPVGEASGAPSGGTGTKTGTGTGTGTGSGGSTGGKSQTEKQEGKNEPSQ